MPEKLSFFIACHCIRMNQCVMKNIFLSDRYCLNSDANEHEHSPESIEKNYNKIRKDIFIDILHVHSISFCVRFCK